MIAPYSIACVQAIVYPYYTDESLDPHPENLERNLQRACELVSFHARMAGARLYQFSEFFLTSSPAGSSADVHRALGVKVPGPELDQLGAAARKSGVYIAGMVYEVDADWPDRFFNTAFIIGPEGKLLLKYRKHYDNNCNTKPGDVWDEHLSKYGVESLFPVVETELGRLACMTAYEINYPEVARGLVLNGAEVLLHMTSEIRGPSMQHRVGGWDICRAVRAYENLSYLASTNEALFLNSRRPRSMMHGHSQIIDYLGRTVNIAETDNETIVAGEIDIEALRLRRGQVGHNFLAQLQPHIYARVLRQHEAELWPKNAWAKEPVKTARQNNQLVLDAVDRMQKRGTYAAPDDWSAELIDNWL